MRTGSLAKQLNNNMQSRGSKNEGPSLAKAGGDEGGLVMVVVVVVDLTLKNGC